MSNNKKQIVKAVFSNETETEQVFVNLTFDKKSIEITATFKPEISTTEEQLNAKPPLHLSCAKHFIDRILSFEKE